jgi:hypothetical protein
MNPADLARAVEQGVRAAVRPPAPEHEPNAAERAALAANDRKLANDPLAERLRAAANQETTP